MTNIPYGMPPRSRLLHIEPPGIGTWKVPSLTSYLENLALAHNVTVADLMKYLAKYLDCIQFSSRDRINNGWWHGCATINGNGTMEENFSSALGSLTQVFGLKFLTLHPWTNVLPSYKLIRPKKAWCPHCYEEQAHNQENHEKVYDLLLWCLQAVTVCPQHCIPLTEHCSFCGESQCLLRPRSRPGYCQQCNHWLGQAKPAVQSAELHGRDTFIMEVRATNLVADLIASPHLAHMSSRETISTALRLCIDKCCNGNETEFARQTGVVQPALGHWLKNRKRPSLFCLIRICLSVGVSLIDVLIANMAKLEVISGEFEYHLFEIPVTPHRDPIDDATLLLHLETALLESPPPSLTQIASRLNYTHNSAIRKRFRALSQKISMRHMQHQHQLKVTNDANLSELIENAVLELFNAGIYPARHRVEKLSGINLFPGSAGRKAWADALQKLGLSSITSDM